MKIKIGENFLIITIIVEIMDEHISFSFELKEVELTKAELLKEILRLREYIKF